MEPSGTVTLMSCRIVLWLWPRPTSYLMSRHSTAAEPEIWVASEVEVRDDEVVVVVSTVGALCDEEEKLLLEVGDRELRAED